MGQQSRHLEYGGSSERYPSVLLLALINNQIWDLFENQHLFSARDKGKQHSNAQHLAEMVAILGPPPVGFIRQSEYARDFFDEQGTCPCFPCRLLTDNTARAVEESDQYSQRFTRHHGDQSIWFRPRVFSRIHADDATVVS